MFSNDSTSSFFSSLLRQAVPPARTATANRWIEIECHSTIWNGIKQASKQLWKRTNHSFSLLIDWLWATNNFALERYDQPRIIHSFLQLHLDLADLNLPQSIDRPTAMHSSNHCTHRHQSSNAFFQSSIDRRLLQPWCSLSLTVIRLSARSCHHHGNRMELANGWCS